MKLWTINFDQNPCCFLIILIFGFGHVFDIVCEMYELSQNENSRFSLYVKQNEDFHVFQRGAQMQIIEY